MQHSRSRHVLNNDAKPLSQDPQPANQAIFLSRDVQICIEDLCTAYPQSIFCKDLSREPKAAFAILLLGKTEEIKSLPIALLFNNLLPQVTMDRRANPK